VRQWSKGRFPQFADTGKEVFSEYAIAGCNGIGVRASDSGSRCLISNDASIHSRQDISGCVRRDCLTIFTHFNYLFCSNGQGVSIPRGSEHEFLCSPRAFRALVWYFIIGLSDHPGTAVFLSPRACSWHRLHVLLNLFIRVGESYWLGATHILCVGSRRL